MKKILIVLLFSLFAFSCLTTGDLNEKVVVSTVEIADVDVVFAVVEVEPAQPAEELKLLPTEQQIIDAVKAYDLETLTDLLDGIDDVKTIVGEDVLLLHLAEEAMGMSGDKNEISALLIEKKAYLLQRDENGKSFERLVIEMEMAGTPRHEYIMEVLGDKFQKRIEALRADSLDDIKAMTGFMPVDENLLLDAVGEKAARIAVWAIESGLPVDLVEKKHGQNLMHLACNNKPYDHAFDDRTGLVKALISAGADVNHSDKKGDTPIGRLFLSVQSDPSRKMGSPCKLAEVLINSGADVNQITTSNYSLLRIAAEAKLDETVRLLLDRGAVMDEGTLVSMNLSTEAMLMFIAAGADTAFFADNLTGIFDAEARYEFTVALMENGVDVAAFDLRQVRNDLKTLAYLVENGADINAGMIMVAVISDYKGMEVIEYLVENGADLTKRYMKDMTVLHYAVKDRRNDVVVYLIEHGAELNPVDSTGKTPLDYCSSKNTKLTAILVDSGAKNASEL
ncbi:MAG: ankyrin repeat domain-containing protein [Spirochaetales bacterium]|nr:ankyrin repeat domain-containing protein [Spirochaetales bacterium]